MAKNLLIVESPNKIAKIQSFLDVEEWKVIASVGHIRDLATWGTRYRLGLDLDTMEPEYISLKDKKDIIKNIILESNDAENIYLATDPDREGEAIAYHITKVIENEKLDIFRITYNEITKDSVLNAIMNPVGLNNDLIQSQEARRVLDRMIGFRLSYLTNKKISAKSAGRVKSSVLKLIIERENEIEKFVPDFWWTINGALGDDKFLINVDSEKFSEIRYKEKEEAEKIHKSLTGKFNFIERKELNRKIKPPVPLEMATYLMAMYNSYGTPNRSATFATQSLYEKGLITYPRTDSKRISSKEFIESIEKYIKGNYGKEYYKGVPIVKSKAGDQDAHEAIRPVDITKTPSTIVGLKVNEKRAYTLIWMLTVKAFMIEGQNKVVKDIYKDLENYFAYKRSYPLLPGFRVVDGIEAATESEAEKSINIDIEKIKVNDHETKPPGRYNPSSLVKLMKEVGIGRPSTYAGVTAGLVGFGYLENNGGALKPTPMAKEVNDLLQGHFEDIVNEEYTAQMEEALDEIAIGNKDSRDYLKHFWEEFEPRVEKADEEIPKKPVVYTGKDCLECETGKLIIKRGRFGEFVACDQYPDCKHSEPLIPKPKPKDAGEECPECGKPLVVRASNRTKNKFIACSGFPKCKFINPEEKTIETLINLDEITKEQKEVRVTKLKKRIEKEKTKELKLKLKAEKENQK